MSDNLTANAQTWIVTTDRDDRRTYVHSGGYWASQTGPREWSVWSVAGDYCTATTYRDARAYADEWHAVDGPAAPAPVVPAPVVADVPADDTHTRWVASRAALHAARAARPVRDRRPVDRPRGYVPTTPVPSTVDWSDVVTTGALDRYRRTSEILAAHGFDDVADEAPSGARASHVDGATPDRAILAGDWTDGHGHGSDDTTHAVASWALRQPADAVAVLPLRSIVADAVDAVTAATDDPTPALLADTIRHGQAHAASSGRIVSSRLAACTGIGAGLSPNRAAGAAARALDTWTETVAGVALDLLDVAEAGTRPVLYVFPADPAATLPDGSRVARARRTRRGLPPVVARRARTVARGVTLDREVHGLTFTYGQGVPVPFLVPVHTYRATRADGSTWQATDAGARRHVGRVPAVATDENGYPAALGYSRVTVVQGAPIVRPDAPATVAGEAVHMVTPTRDHGVTTVHPDLTRAAVADMLAEIRDGKPRRTRAARPAAPAAPAAPSARDRLRARATMRTR